MTTEKEKQAIRYLQNFQPKDVLSGEDEAYYLCYSGGKDSDCILTLAKLAGVKYDAVHNLTTVDAPETVRYIKSQPEIIIERPKKTMWQLIAEKRMPPTRIARYCCAELKERGGRFRKKITGVRWAESINRARNSGLVKIVGKEKTVRKLAEEAGLDSYISPKGGLVMNDDNDETRGFVDHCYRTTSVMINPIVNWTDDDVWEFLHHYGIKSNPLYQVSETRNTYVPCQKTRIGCVGCPMARKASRISDLISYPKYRDAYLRAFKKMQELRKADGLPLFLNDVYKDLSPEAIMMWWLDDDPRQLSLFGTPDYLKGAKI